MNLVIAKLFATLTVSALAVGAAAPEPATAIKMKSALDGKPAPSPTCVARRARW